MEESIDKRMSVLRKELGLSKAKFAERIGVTGQFISMIEAGKSKLTEANLRLICFTFNVSESWLRTGEGEMMDEEAALSAEEKRLLEFFRRLSPTAQKMAISHIEQLIDYERGLRDEKGEEEDDFYATKAG